MNLNGNRKNETEKFRGIRKVGKNMKAESSSFRAVVKK